jgi:hypothetical protein
VQKTTLNSNRENDKRKSCFFAAFFGEKEEKFSSMLGEKRKVLSFFPTL